ncbi:MAG: DUF429 domain-containing protein [Trueperaceae bacterium]|nr:DUF429 domain-containing protein [Trueperaceae bacterium]
MNLIQVIGIDCATDWSRIGVAFGRVIAGKITIEVMEPASTDALAQIISLNLAKGKKILLALDAPLGWPSALGQNLAEHQAGAVISIEANKLFRRDTDEFVRARIGKQSLDVGADRIARTALSTLKIISELEKVVSQAIPLVWEANFSENIGCIEVYPAATLKAYGLPNTGYKKNTANELEQRKIILEELSPRLAFAGDSENVLLGRDHDFDATLCVLAAYDFLQDNCYFPTDLKLAQKEGWIWVRNKENNHSRH